MIGQSHPGLVSREVIAADEEFVTIREVWDLKAPGCPMVAIRRPADWFVPGARVMETDPTAISCERFLRMTAREAEHNYGNPTGA